MTRARNLSNFKPSPEGLVEANDVEAGVAEANLGFTPVNKAGDTLTGVLTFAEGQTFSNIDLAGSVTGTLGVANGGTGLTSPGTAGNALISDGTGWVSQALPEPPQLPFVKKPTNLSPADEETDLGEFTGSITLTGSAFNPIYSANTMAASQWQVSSLADFSAPEVDTGDIAGSSVSYTFNASAVLDTDTVYFWRVRYKDSDGNYSDFSDPTEFTTASSFGLPAPGTALEGGFFAGVIVQGGNSFAIIVAPRASGENTSLQYKNTNDAAPAATQTLNNGPAATAAMVAAGNSTVYPAAHFCNNLTINGFSDWYLPARDELELCYRNLKPTTGANNTGNRSQSAYTYPEGNDQAAGTIGVNRNSDPTGAAYTSGSPAQTSVSDFQTGNTEAFASAFYWSSSEFSSTNAWAQEFSNGFQENGGKNISVYVRAVRRIAL